MPVDEGQVGVFWDARVGVFWDAENVRVTNAALRETNAGVICNKIREFVQGYGRIIQKFYYYDAKDPAEVSVKREELDMSGFVLVDCPKRKGTKETLDKKLIVDMSFFALETLHAGAKCTVVLLSGDGDYAYTLSKLRDRGVFTVVIYPAETTFPTVLFNSADVKRSWFSIWHDEPLLEAGSTPAATPDASAPGAAAPDASAPSAAGAALAPEPSGALETVSYDAISSVLEDGSVDSLLHIVRQKSGAHFAHDSVVYSAWCADFGKQKELYVSQRQAALEAKVLQRNPDTIHMELKVTAVGLAQLGIFEDGLDEKFLAIVRAVATRGSAAPAKIGDGWAEENLVAEEWYKTHDASKNRTLFRNILRGLLKTDRLEREGHAHRVRLPAGSSAGPA